MALGLPTNWRKTAAALAGAVIAVLGFVPWSVAPGPWRDTAMQRLSGALGAEDFTARKVRFALLPTPRLELQDIGFVQRGGATRAQAPAALVQLRILPLLKGVAKAASLSLGEPVIDLAVAATDERGFRQFAQLASHGGVLQLPASLRALSKVSIDRGKLNVRYGDTDVADRYEDLRLRLTPSMASKPLTIVMSAKRNGEDLQASFQGGSLNAIETAQLEPITFNYWTPGLSVEFDGKGSLNRKTSFAGTLLVRAGTRAPAPFTPALAGLGIDALPPLELSALLDFSDRGANLSDLRVTLDRDRFDGAGAVRHDGQRWHVSGTLAAGQADLSRLFTALTRIRSADGAWNTRPIETEALFAANIDLRVSADQLTILGQHFGKAALALMARPSRIEATLADSLYEGGQARLRLVANPGTEGLDIKVNGSLDQVDLGATIANFTRTQRFKGRGNASLSLEASGRSVAQFVANADGRLSAALRDGELIGINLNHLANRRAARPELLLADALGGRTPFESTTLNARITRGLAAPVDGYLQGGRLIGSLTGSVDFAQGVTSLSGSVVQMPAEAFVVEPVPVIDFNVSGPISEPRITPNIAAMLKRS